MREYFSSIPDGLPSFRISLGPGNLSTPVAYLAYHFLDPWTKVPYGYAIAGDNENPRHLLFSPGPSKEWDGINELLRAFRNAESNDAVAQDLYLLAYDPTNGSLSRGFVYRASTEWDFKPLDVPVGDK